MEIINKLERKYFYENDDDPSLNTGPEMASPSGGRIDRVTDSVGQTRVLSGITGAGSYFQSILVIEIKLMLKI